MFVYFIIIMKEGGLNLQIVSKNFKALLLASLLYPLQRIQSIQQVQSTYSNAKYRNTKEIISQAIHYGRKSYFRGLSTFAMKAALLTTSIRTTNSISANHSNERVITQVLSSGLAAACYFLFYPLEVINIRMSVQIEMQKFYQNVRSCASKIKRNQGVQTFYRGFMYSCLLFTGQIALVREANRRFQCIKNGNSEWQQISIFLGLIAASQTLLYPFNTIKKMYQVNGGLGHTDQNYSLRRTFQATDIPSMYRGISTRMINLLAYTFLYSWWLADNNKE